jgi:hypothetical protein
MDEPLDERIAPVRQLGESTGSAMRFDGFNDLIVSRFRKLPERQFIHDE